MIKIKKRLLAGLLGLALTLCSCAESSSDKTNSSSGTQTSETTAETTTSVSETQTSSSSPDSSRTDSVPEGVPMWEGTAPNGNKITFLGTMHAAKDDFYPIPEKISKPFKQAEVVAFECDTESAEDEQSQFELQQDMMLKDGTKLADHLSAESYKILSEHLTELNASIDLVNGFKPWAAYESLTSLWIMKSSISLDKGIDYYLMRQTKSEGKTLYELESAQAQLDLVAKQPEKVYDALIKLTKDQSIKTYNEENEKLYDCWLKGDVAKMETMSVLPTDELLKTANLTDEEIALVRNRNKQLVDDRNVIMANGIKELFKSGKKTMVCVGCAHYYGTNGIIALLEKDGYSFKRI